MIIALSGAAGAGKTTVAKKLAKKLGFKHHYMGGIRRAAAEKQGMTIEEFNKLGETDPSTDKIVDDFLIELGKNEDNFIAEGRTAFHFIPHAVKIYLAIDPLEGAKRIFKEKQNANMRNELAVSTVEEQLEEIEKRQASDNKRYQQYYNIDCNDMQQYDFVLDTSHLAPDDIVEKILNFIKTKQ